MKLLRVLASAAAYLAFASAVQAAPILSSPTGIAAAATIDFSEVAVANDAALTNQFAAFGVNFAGLFYNGCSVRCVTTPPDGAKPDITNFTNSDLGVFSPTSSISFATPVLGAAFDWASNLGEFTFTAYLGATLVESFSVIVRDDQINGHNGWGYYGFHFITLDRITIDSNQAFLIDNLQVGRDFGPVPEPATLLFFGSGLLGIAACRRRTSEPPTY